MDEDLWITVSDEETPYRIRADAIMRYWMVEPHPEKDDNGVPTGRMTPWACCIELASGSTPTLVFENEEHCRNLFGKIDAVLGAAPAVQAGEEHTPDDTLH